MTSAVEAAARLRQAAQGCTQHIHGPVQAWSAVVDDPDMALADVRLVVHATHIQRINELADQGVKLDDPRMVKEIQMFRFLWKLLS